MATHFFFLLSFWIRKVMAGGESSPQVSSVLLPLPLEEEGSSETELISVWPTPEMLDELGVGTVKRRGAPFCWVTWYETEGMGWEGPALGWKRTVGMG
ncbi:hypothetical protein AVEN_266581-1 [Araneus ventricosus]|uniref:Uncharacterized protein n=1 Tax=Araneus ventricosus TaxID=182803 RepID=A0A4Y2Q4L1_ARAVE|nr:hypothetical protein AVEN_266581-1 [Araneus ventricosus]